MIRASSLEEAADEALTYVAGYEAMIDVAERYGMAFMRAELVEKKTQWQVIADRLLEEQLARD
jgi:hypothetical protein